MQRHGSDVLRGGHAIHVRHLKIHQDQVVGILPGQLDCLQAIGGQVNRQAGVLQQVNGHFLVQRVVFSQQHVQARARLQHAFGLRVGQVSRRGFGAAQGVRHHLQKCSGGHRLGHETVKVALRQVVGGHFAHRAHQQRQWTLCQVQGRQLRAGGNAIGAWHGPVHQHHAVRVGQAVGGCYQRQTLLARVGSVHACVHF